ncbi:MAG: DNA-deoxyinosine glycosylase [Lachnospiraceae bacterium]|nr:DNA-deoxyinosine glycosylase [Lachnospiraceae bacterium]
MASYEHVVHTFEPVFDKNSRILILGSLPSVKSREAQFYYGHPQNRFWKLLALLTNSSLPENIGEKRELLLANKIALWDVIQSCDIIGSSDSSIKNVVPCDLPGLLTRAPIERIYGNGAKACQLYRKYCQPKTGREILPLPSTSPANAAFSLERLRKIWEEELRLQ